MTYANPLFRSPTDVQRDLLHIIAAHVVAPASADEAQQWPSWAWICDKLEDQGWEDVDPAEVLTSLPTIPGDGSRRPYGLVWRSAYHTPDPTDEERVGLSIAGFAWLDTGMPIADALTHILRELARSESESARSTVAGSTVKDVPLKPYLLDAKPGVFGPQTRPDVFADVLNREYFQLINRWNRRLGNLPHRRPPDEALP